MLCKVCGNEGIGSCVLGISDNGETRYFMDYCLRYDFHPVGQGLFASGMIGCLSSNLHQCFHWVYDCGTSSRDNFISDAIKCLKQNVASNNRQSRPRLNLVTISHFDGDHISGLKNLLSEFDVDTLLIPYMPLWQRLVIAFEERADVNDKIIQFFVNPVFYIGNIADAKVDKIIFVPFSGKIIPPKKRNTKGPKESQSEADWELKAETREPKKDEEDDYKNMKQGSKISIKFMCEGSTLCISNVWEFIPYNDAELAPNVDKTFRKNVEKEKYKLINGSDVDAALKRLRVLYDKQFGKSPRKRNMISLFLYGGPIDIKRLVRVTPSCYICPGHLPQCLYWCTNYLHADRCAILYTGDGYLNNQKRLNALTSCLGDGRISRLHTLQVMHHGAKPNWYTGVATTLKPAISVFCSDPDLKRPGHPHASVLRDFASHGPMLVSKNYQLTISGLWTR